MFKTDRTFIKGLLTESSKETVSSLIKYFDLPILLERTLTELYVEGLCIKKIAYKYNVDERTIKRYHTKALDLAEANVLDLAEERLFTGLFGSTTLDAKAQWLLKFLGIDINDLIQNFEGVVKPLMDDDGLVNAELARSLVSTKSPLLSNIIPTYNFRFG